MLSGVLTVLTDHIRSFPTVVDISDLDRPIIKFTELCIKWNINMYNSVKSKINRVPKDKIQSSQLYITTVHFI